MPDEARLVGALVLSFAGAFAATPAAIRAAWRLDLLDHPVGWKAHGTPTPYLGGLGVVAGFILGYSVGEGLTDLGAVLLGALGLLVLGVFDDRASVRPMLRVAVEIAAALLLVRAGLGWSVFTSESLNTAVTVLWVVGLINAVNLLDLMDGVATSTVAAGAAGAAGMALLADDVVAAGLALPVVGACLGFLPYNLRSPARVFLGDGGSMPLGFLLAASVMVASTGHSALGWPILLVGGLLVAVPILDMAVRIVSRLTRGVSLMTAGQDSVANRIRDRLFSARKVVLSLVLLQAVFSAVALATVESGRTGLIAAATALGAVAGFAGLWVLDRPVRGQLEQTDDEPSHAEAQRGPAATLMEEDLSY